MRDLITPAQFHASEGTGNWRVLATCAATRVSTPSFAQGAGLLERISELAEGLDCQPEADLRSNSVTIRLAFRDAGAPSSADVSLARAISAQAAALGLTSGHVSVKEVLLAIDAISIPAVAPFWMAVLGYVAKGEEDIIDPDAISPWIWFQQMDAPRTQRNRVHLDIYVPHDQVRLRIDAAIAAGGRIVTSGHAPAWWVLADPEGNEACLATHMEFENPA